MEIRAKVSLFKKGGLHTPNSVSNQFLWGPNSQLIYKNLNTIFLFKNIKNTTFLNLLNKIKIAFSKETIFCLSFVAWKYPFSFIPSQTNIFYSGQFFTSPPVFKAGDYICVSMKKSLFVPKMVWFTANFNQKRGDFYSGFFPMPLI